MLATPRCWAEVDLAALRQNLGWIHHQAGFDTPDHDPRQSRRLWPWIEANHRQSGGEVVRHDSVGNPDPNQRPSSEGLPGRTRGLIGIRTISPSTIYRFFTAPRPASLLPSSS